jgi:ATP-dependent DNA ligase
MTAPSEAKASSRTSEDKSSLQIRTAHSTASGRNAQDGRAARAATRAAVEVLLLKPPAGPEWVHEIKHDGYRLQVRREGDAVQLFTRKNYDWSDRYPAIAATAMKLRAQSFTLDGEACVCGPDGVAVFDALHRRGTVREAMLYAFDLLELDGEDLRHIHDRNRPLAARRVPSRRDQRTPLFAHIAERHRFGRLGRGRFGRCISRPPQVAADHEPSGSTKPKTLTQFLPECFAS